MAKKVQATKAKADDWRGRVKGVTDAINAAGEVHADRDDDPRFQAAQQRIIEAEKRAGRLGAIVGRGLSDC